MKTKYLTATLFSGILMWGVAGLWHEILMAHLYSNQMHGEHKGLGIILIAYLVLAFLMTLIYSVLKFPSKINGIFFGMIVGLLWVFPHELAMAGAHGTSITYVFKNALWHIVEQGIGGLIIGLVIKPMPKE